MKLNNKVLGAGLFALLAFLFVYMAGGFSDKIESAKRHHRLDIDKLETMTLVTTQQVNKRVFPGVVSAKQSADIAARLTANVVEVMVDVGDNVTKGDLLLRLESDDLDAIVEQSVQSLSSTQAQLNNARKEYRRAEDLVKKKLIPQSQFDSAESRLKSAQASFNQAKAAVAEAETAFGFSVISAPFDAVITAKSVNAGDTATPGSSLLRLYNPQSLQVEVDVSESALPFVTLGLEVMITFPTVNQSTQAKIIEITPSADAGSRSYKIKLDFNAELGLFPGTYSQVMIPMGTRDELIVPTDAITQVGQLDYVKVLADGQLETRLVQLGEGRRVRKGLSAGETIVLNPN